ncbi:MAG: hypothetical protein U5K56_14565 [Halioglobus sp.]|nr:hypothetical protein [Halioglobus sp.]
MHYNCLDAKLESAPKESGWRGSRASLPMRLATSRPATSSPSAPVRVDALPAPKGQPGLAGHLILLKENGIYLLETMSTGPLARDGVHDFLFVLGQARVRGAVQMIINPVAIR